MQTWQAYNYMMLAETRDTNGVALWGTNLPTGTYAPMLCNKDVWAGIVALLDSGETNLVAGGTAVAALPVSLPPGFNSVSRLRRAWHRGLVRGFQSSAPGESGPGVRVCSGAKRWGSAPTATTAGHSPRVRPHRRRRRGQSLVHLQQRHGRIRAARRRPSMADPFGVYHSFSGASGDIPNPYPRGHTNAVRAGCCGQ